MATGTAAEHPVAVVAAVDAAKVKAVVVRDAADKEETVVAAHREATAHKEIVKDVEAHAVADATKVAAADAVVTTSAKKFAPPPASPPRSNQTNLASAPSPP